MHVSKKYHLRVVLALGFAILLLSAFLALTLIKVHTLTYEQPVVDEAYVGTSTDHYEAPESPFLKEEEAVIIPSGTQTDEEFVLPVQKVLFEYVEVTEGCNQYFVGECVNVRSGPGTEYPVVTRLRNDVVLKVGGKVERDGMVWYKIVYDDEWLRYPERVTGDWYVSADYVEVLFNEGDMTIWDSKAGTTSKQIIIDRSEQKLYAFDGDTLFLETPISTGIELTPTPRGTFSIFKKTPSRYMQGPIIGVSTKYYDLPGVPWNLYFTNGGAVIHGAYWHDKFGSPYSNGCVNLPPRTARILYRWAVLGTSVTVQN